MKKIIKIIKTLSHSCRVYWLKLLGYSAILYSFSVINNWCVAKEISKVVTISGVQDTISKTVISLGAIIGDISLVAGIGFLLASFFKFDQHKKNPTQIPVSQPLTLLVLGAALCMMPTIMPLVQTAAFGSKAERGAVGTATIKKLIGS